MKLKAGLSSLSLSLSRIRHNYPKVLFLIIPILIGLIASVFIITNKPTNQAQAAGNTYYVSQTNTNGYAIGLDTNNGLQKTTPFLTISQAMHSSVAGDAIVLNDGTYLTTAGTWGASLLSLNKTITINAENPLAVIIQGTNVDYVARITLTTASTITLGAIVLDGRGATGRALSVDGTANYPTIVLNGTNLIGFTGYGIHFSSGGSGHSLTTNDIDIESSNITDTAGHGINDINNEIKNITINGCNLNLTAANGNNNTLVAVEFRATTNGVLSNVIISDITGTVTAGDVGSFWGVLVRNIPNAIVENSNFRVNGASTVGIKISSLGGYQSDGGIIRDNNVVINGTSVYGIQIGESSSGAENNKSNNGKIYRNTVSRIEDGNLGTPHGIAIGPNTGGEVYDNRLINFNPGILTAITDSTTLVHDNIIEKPYGVQQLYAKGANGTRFYNNTVYNYTGYNSIPLAVRDHADGTHGQNVVYSNNIIFNSSTNPQFIVVDVNNTATFTKNLYYSVDALIANSWSYQGNNYCSFALWQQAGHDTGSIAEDPHLYSSSNFNLQCNSPAIDAGSDMGRTIDYAGNPIYGTPDIGAYEYQPPHTMVTNKIDVGAGARVYGNGKFRDKNTITASEADLSVIPTGGFVAGVYTAWLDITNISWSNTGTHHKSWQESNAIAGLTNTIHTVGDLEANKYYKVTVDSGTNNLTGSNCSTIDGNYVCKSNSSGKITFTFTGTYSTHTFDVIEGDNAGPNIYGPTVIFNDNSATISWTTNESSTSRVDYGFTDNYNSMQEDTNMVTEHHVGLTDLMPCHEYHYRVYSKDSSGNDRFSTDNTFTTEGCPAPLDTGSWRYFSGAYATSSSLGTSSTASTSQGIPSTGTMDSSIRFDASNLFPGKSITKYIWDFGDGKTDEGRIVNHKYSSPNRYTVKVTGYDKDGNEYVFEQTIDINPEVPTIKNITSTNDTDLIIEGNGYKGDTIYLSIHSTPINLTSSVDDTGYWSYTINNASETLGEGDHIVTAIDSFKLADNTELKSSPTDDTKFSVTVDNGKLKVEMEKSNRYLIIIYVLAGLIVVGGVVYLVRRRKLTR